MSKAQKVTFQLESLTESLTIDYDRDHFQNKLRDTITKSSDYNINYYISMILSTLLKLELSTEDLRKIESFQKKFDFLEYKISEDKVIHGLCYKIIGLIHGNKNIIEHSVRPWHILSSERGYLNHKGIGYIGWDATKALCKDVSDITKKCISEFLEELQNSGKIMTSSELAEHIQRTVELSTEEKVPEQSTPSDTHSSTESTSYKEEHGHPSSTTEQNKSNLESVSSANQRAIVGPITEKLQQEEVLVKINNRNNNLHSVDTHSYSEKDNDSSLYDLVNDFAWLDDLPKFIQKMLFPHLLESLNESAKYIKEVFDLKSSKQALFNGNQNDSSSTSNDYDLEDTISEAVSLLNTPSNNYIDMGMILADATVNDDILPVDIGSKFLPDYQMLGLQQEFLAFY